MVVIAGAILGGILFEVMNYILNSFGAIVRNLHRTRLVIQKVKVRMAKRTLEESEGFSRSESP